MSNNNPVYNEPHPVAPSGARGTTSSSPVRANRQGILAPLLASTTIPPGATDGGTLNLDPSHVPPGSPLRVTVAIGGEKHEFVFTVQ